MSSPHLFLPPPPLSILTLLLLLLSTFISSALSSPLSTVAISHVNNRTIVCALLPTKSSYELNCTAFPSGVSRRYPSSAVAAYSAIAAGNGFLCALSSSIRRNFSTMRWWDFTVGAGKNGTNSTSAVTDSKRVYKGPVLNGLDAGDSHVCGLQSNTQELDCWRWPRLRVTQGLKFVDVAVGGDFVCGLLDSGEVRCFGDDDGVVGKEPQGNFTSVAAGSVHACVISADGGLSCWGAGAPSIGQTTPTVSALALGANRTCALRANGTVVCWGEGLLLPEELAVEQFMEIEAKGSAFCGVLRKNYSLVCWGSPVFDQKHLVYERVLPGSCKAMSSCQCGVVPDSQTICVTGVICQPCARQISHPTSPPPMPNSTGNSTSGNRKSGNSTSKVIAIVVGSVGSAVGLAAISCYILFWVSKKSGRIHDSGRLHMAPPPAGNGSVRQMPQRGDSSEQPPERRLTSLLSKGHSSSIEEFPLQALLAATNGFSDEHKVGSGSFGAVYRAVLNDGRIVAVKRSAALASTSSVAATASRRKTKDRELAFLSELALLSRVNHKNLVRLLGYCEERGERALVYEFLSNGSLHDHLHRLPSSPRLSSWVSRLRVALDAARGIEYLHTYAVPPIIHRDIKSSNILLDDAGTAKVSDFGLSLMNLDGGGGAAQESLLAAGTVGYMDPEYYRLQNLTAKSDVYSFGVVLLELLTGCRVIHRYEDSNTPRNVVEFAVPHIVADNVHKVLDPKLPPPSPCEIEAVTYAAYLAADCVNPEGRRRPTMTGVVAALEQAVAAAAEPSPLSRSSTTRSA